MAMDNREQSVRELSIVSFTEPGTGLNEKICRMLGETVCEGYTSARYAGRLNSLPDNLKEWIADRWGQMDFLFIGATGIAVRMIAPCVKDKYTDSAVLSMDEKGKYVIPLLSGHMGGAVELAYQIADCTGAVPVITTATDVQGRFAVDVFAKQKKLAISDRELAKKISAAVLENRKIGIYIAPECRNWIEPVDDVIQVYEELEICESREELAQYVYGIAIVRMAGEKDEKTLQLLPCNMVVGLGCRRDTPYSILEKGITETLLMHGIYPAQLAAIVSIELKAKERGILEYSQKSRVPFLTYTADELKQTGPVSVSSDFVQQITEVDNVCERSVLCFLKEKENGKLIQEKKCLEGMTIAIGTWM